MGFKAGADIDHEAEALGAEAIVAGAAGGLGAKGVSGGGVIADIGIAPGDGAAVGLGAEEDVLDDIAGVDGDAGAGAGVVGGRIEAEGGEPEVAEFVGDEGGEGVLGGLEAGEIEEDEAAVVAIALVAEGEGLGAGEGLGEVGAGEIREEYVAVFGGDGVAGDAEDFDAVEGAGFDLGFPLLEEVGQGKGELEGEQQGGEHALRFIIARVISRRALLGSGLPLGMVGCGSRGKSVFVGYAFVATRDSGDIAVVNLAAFSLEPKRIKPRGRPVHLIDVPGEDVLLSVTETGAVEEVKVSEATMGRALETPLDPGAVWLSHDAATIWGLTRDGKALVAVSRATMRVSRKWALPGKGRGIAVSPGTADVAVSLDGEARVGILRGPGEKELAWTELEAEAGALRYLRNGSMVIAVQEGARQLTLVDTASGKVMVTLPLPIRPENLCFNADGGQLFITGEGVDGVVVVYPYQSQVATTLLSGKAPGPMAVSVAPQFLFVTSPSTGTVSILDVRTQKLAAVVAVGADAEPRAVVVTPDQSMALVLNRKSGDIAIIRLANIVSKRQKTAPLFTMIPVGSAPVAAVVRSFA